MVGHIIFLRSIPVLMPFKEKTYHPDTATVFLIYFTTVLTIHRS